jgi:hypothetical protein
VRDQTGLAKQDPTPVPPTLSCVHTAAELGNYMAAVKHTKGATLTDMQGNTGNVVTEKSAQDGKLIAWGIDRVMMSGASCE